jgi:hypothetical protein
MTPWRQGYIDGVRADVQRCRFTTRKSCRKYQRGYVKGLGTSTLRLLLKQTEEAVLDPIVPKQENGPEPEALSR